MRSGPCGSAHNCLCAGAIDWYVRLQPLQSRLLILFGVRMCTPAGALCAWAGPAAATHMAVVARTGADTSAHVERLLNDQRRCTRFPFVRPLLLGDDGSGASAMSPVTGSRDTGRNLTIGARR